MLTLQNTVAVNYAGNPALAVPIPFRGKGFYVTSMQLIGPKFGEAKLLNAGRFVEDAANLARRNDASLDRLAHACAPGDAEAALR